MFGTHAMATFQVLESIVRKMLYEIWFGRILKASKSRIMDISKSSTVAIFTVELCKKCFLKSRGCVDPSRPPYMMPLISGAFRRSIGLLAAAHWILDSVVLLLLLHLGITMLHRRSCSPHSMNRALLFLAASSDMRFLVASYVIRCG